MSRRTMQAIVFVLGASVAVLARSAEGQVRSWVELAKQDLHAIRETILQNHPGPVDPLNPSYRSWLDSGYTRSLAMADSVRSLDGLIAVVSYYSSGFQDGHLGWSSEFVRRDV
ncbi:MAG TPA: hypothetical protein VH762_02550, partial [Gemmatimonadaceae bacterium]